MAPFTKAGGYYARSWGAYLDGAGGELPVARPTLSLATHALRDEIVLVGLLWRRPLSDARVYERINGEVAEAIDPLRQEGLAEEARRILRCAADPHRCLHQIVHQPQPHA